MKRLKPVRTSAPAARLLTTAEAKAHLRVEASDDETYIDSLVLAAESLLDGWTGIIGRALITQSWSENFSIFSARMPLRIGPVQEITEITYFDGEEVEQTLDEEVYRLHEANGLAYLVEQDGKSWPTTFTRDDAVTISYVAGFGDAATNVPDAIVHAARMLVSHWYHNREAVVTEGSGATMPLAVEHLIAPYRCTWSFYQ